MAALARTGPWASWEKQRNGDLREMQRREDVIANDRVSDACGSLCGAGALEIKPHPAPGFDCRQVMLEAPLTCFGRAVRVLLL